MFARFLLTFYSASDAVDTEAGARMCQGSVDQLNAAWNRLTDKANVFPQAVSAVACAF